MCFSNCALDTTCPLTHSDPHQSTEFTLIFLCSSTVWRFSLHSRRFKMTAKFRPRSAPPKKKFIVLCFSVYFPALSFLSFAFLKRQGKPPKKRGYFITTEPPKSLEKKGKQSKKRKPSQGKKNRELKKYEERKDRQGKKRRRHPKPPN